MSTKLAKSVVRVQATLQKLGLEFELVELAVSARTAQQAAEALDCPVSCIAKSLIFQGKESRKPILIVASGANRVNEKLMKQHVGEKLKRADADFVLAETGYAIGGIPPIGHNNPIATYIDQDLLNHESIWVAAGTPHAVFRLKSDDLVRITQGKTVSVK